MAATVRYPGSRRSDGCADRAAVARRYDRYSASADAWQRLTTGLRACRPRASGCGMARVRPTATMEIILMVPPPVDRGRSCARRPAPSSGGSARGLEPPDDRAARKRWRAAPIATLARWEAALPPELYLVRRRRTARRGREVEAFLAAGPAAYRASGRAETGSERICRRLDRLDRRPVRRRCRHGTAADAARHPRRHPPHRHHQPAADAGARTAPRSPAQGIAYPGEEARTTSRSPGRSYRGQSGAREVLALVEAARAAGAAR